MCYKCNSSFSTTAELSQHQPTHFTEEKPFSCSLCQERFSTFTEVGKLILLMFYVFAINCEPCWSFVVLQLNQHRRKDCGERRFLCVDCGARFPVPFRLRKHRIAMHPEKEAAAEDIDMFQCCKCGVVFQTEDELLQHQEETADCDLEESRGKKRACEPTPISQEVEVDKKIKQEDVAKEYPDSTSSVECKIPCPEDDCNCMFATVEALRAHKKDLHRPRPLKALSSEYSCLTCGKSFARESTLKAHQTSHFKTEKSIEKRWYRRRKLPPLVSHHNVIHVAWWRISAWYVRISLWSRIMDHIADCFRNVIYFFILTWVRTSTWSPWKCLNFN